MTDEPGALQRDVARLTQERTELFGRSVGGGGLSPVDQRRLHAIERQLDQCYTALRRARAARATARQDRVDAARRRNAGRRHH